MKKNKGTWNAVVVEPFISATAGFGVFWLYKLFTPLNVFFCMLISLYTCSLVMIIIRSKRK